MTTMLKNKSILIIGFAEAVSNIGNWITMMSIYAIVIFRNDGSTVESSGIFLAGMLPLMLASPIAGQLADKYDRKKLMMGSEFLSGLAVVMIILTHQITFIYVFLAVQACAMSIMGPARSASIPGLVAHKDLVQVNAFLQQITGMVKIAGPIIAGALLSIVDPYQALILDVVTFGLSIIILSQLPSLMPVKSEAAPINRIDEGLKPIEKTIMTTLKSTPLLSMLFVLMFFAVMTIMSFDILSSILTRDILQGDEGLFGLIIGAVGVGTIIASVVLMLDKSETTIIRAWYGVILGISLLAVIPFSLVIAIQFTNLTILRGIIILGAFIGGLGNGLSIIQVSTLLQLLSPPELLGRINGVFQSVLVGGQLVTVIALPFIVPVLLPMETFFTIATGVIIIMLALTVIMLQQNHPERKQKMAAIEG